MAGNDWIVKINDRVKKEEETNMADAEKKKWERRSIYKLPACVAGLDKKAFTPQLVSIGPYHCKNGNLKPMEEHKDRALARFLRRTKVPLDHYVKALQETVEDLMDAYDSLDDNFLQNPNAFLELLIRDGCFMLEIFRAWQENFDGYAANDPVFSEHGRLYVMPHLNRDMMMLENQIPMKVLHKLHQVQYGLATSLVSEEEANKLALEFFFPKSSNNELPSDILHILDMIRKRKLQGGADQKEKKVLNEVIYKGGDDIIRSAVELQEAGIKFKRSKTRSLKDITFNNGVLSLPMIIVDDTTKTLFLNLIAFERFHVRAGNEVTAYVFFMDNIIDDAPDIRLLHASGIIQNGIGSDKEAAKLFNSLSKDVTLDANSRMGTVHKKVNDYCKRLLPKYRAILWHTYFTNPWAIISVLAAILLFALTIAQTVYSVIAFYKPPGT